MKDQLINQMLPETDLFEHRDLVYKMSLKVHNILLEKMAYFWTKKYYFLDPGDVESMLHESLFVAINTYRPSKGQSFKNFLWRICGWSMKSLVMEGMHRGDNKKVSLENLDFCLKADFEDILEKRLFINKIYSESTELCRKILDGVKEGRSYTEIGRSLVDIAGRKLFPSEISYYISTIRDKYISLI